MKDDPLFPPADLVRYVHDVRTEAEKSIFASLIVQDNILSDVKAGSIDGGRKWRVLFMLNGERVSIDIDADPLGYSRAKSRDWIANAIAEALRVSVVRHFMEQVIP